MVLVETGRREALGQILSRGRRELLADWQGRRTTAVPATRRLSADDLRREDAELFDLLTEAVRTGMTDGLARFATTVIERRLVHQFLAEEILAETTILRQLCDARVPEGPERADLLFVLWQVFDAYIEELFRVATEFLILRLDQRTTQLERFYSFSEVILNTIQDGVIVTDLHGRIIKVNRTAQELLRYEEEEMLGLAPPYPFWEPSEDACTRSPVEECLLSGRAVHDLEVVFRTRIGDTVPFHVHTVPMRGQNGETSGGLIVFRDLREMKRLISELRQAKSSLEERVSERTRQIEDERERLERILQSLFDMVFIIDLDGRIADANDAAAQALGIERANLAGRLLSALTAEGEGSALERARRRCAAQGQPIPELQDRLLDASFVAIPVAANFAPLRDAEGALQGVVCVARNVRDRLTLETRQSVANNINRILAGTLDVRTQFDEIRQELGRLFEFDRMSITVEVLGGSGFEVYCVSAESAELRVRPGALIPTTGSLSARATSERRILRVPDLAATEVFESSFLVKAGIRSSMMVPLTRHGRVVGSLNFGSRRLNDFEAVPDDLLNEIANQIAVAVENSRAFSDTAYAASLHAAVLAAIGDPVLITDCSMRILFINGPVTAMTGLTSEDAVGRSWVEAVRPTDLEAARTIHDEIMRTGSIERRRMAGRRRDGSPITVEFSSGLVRDPEGRPQQIITIMREVFPEPPATAV